MNIELPMYDGWHIFRIHSTSYAAYKDVDKAIYGVKTLSMYADNLVSLFKLIDESEV